MAGYGRGGHRRSSLAHSRTVYTLHMISSRGTSQLFASYRSSWSPRVEVRGAESAARYCATRGVAAGGRGRGHGRNLRIRAISPYDATARTTCYAIGYAPGPSDGCDGAQLRTALDVC